VVIFVDHTIVHFEIPADDVEKMKKFYSDLFGWKIERFPGPTDYWSVQTVPVDEKGMVVRPGVNGGMMKKQMPEQKPVNYISVESVDEYSKKVISLGGQIIVPKMEIPGMDWWAMALDPEGNQIGLFEVMQAMK
jgi:predicted enzyme related to lactoylglutathione lyase